VKRSVENRPFERPKRKWEDRIKMDLEKVGCGVWTELILFRIRSGACECGNKP
jgi:hypothetical protein